MVRLILAWLFAAGVACAEPALKAKFDETGIAGIAAAELGKHWPGLAIDAVVVRCGDETVPWVFERETLYFPVTRPGTVWILPAGGRPARAEDVDQAKDEREHSRPSVTRHEQDLIFDRLETHELSLIDKSDRPFFWAAIAGEAKLRVGESDDVRKARIRIRFQAMRTPGVEHHVTVSLDGKELGSAKWTGGEPYTAEFEAKLKAGDLVFGFKTEDKPSPRVIASGPIGDGPIYVDWIEIEGSRGREERVASWTGDGETLTKVLDIGFAIDAKLRVQRVTRAAGRIMTASWKGVLKAPLLEKARPVAPPGAGADWLVIAPEDLRGTLSPLLERRRSQGLSPMFVSMEDVREAASADVGGAEAVRLFIRDAAKSWPEPKLKYVLLVGDADRGAETGIPASLTDALGAGWTATDGPFALLDDDDLPDIAVGRWPARTPQEAALLLAKVLRFEDAPAGEWRRRLHLTLGTAGFGPQLDGLLKSGGMKIASDLVPRSFSFTVQSTHDLGLPFTWPHSEYNDLLNARARQGALVLAYSGHGYETGLQSLRWRGKRYPILDSKLATKIDPEHGLPMIFLFACLTGSFDEAEDCLAEALARAPGGGALVVASSGISHPYADMIFAKELMQVLFGDRTPVFGDGLLAARRRCLEGNDAMRQLIDGMAAGAVGGPETRERFRRDGALAYNLFGDPATRIPWPGKAKLKAKGEVTAGETLGVSGSADLGDGTVLVTLEADRLKSVEPLEPVDLEAEGSDDVIKRNWARMNDPVAARVETAMKEGKFSAAIEVPAGTPRGNYVLKIYASDGKKDAVTSKKIEVAEKE